MTGEAERRQFPGTAAAIRRDRPATLEAAMPVAFPGRALQIIGQSGRHELLPCFVWIRLWLGPLTEQVNRTTENTEAPDFRNGATKSTE